MSEPSGYPAELEIDSFVSFETCQTEMDTIMTVTYTGPVVFGPRRERIVGALMRASEALGIPHLLAQANRMRAVDGPVFYGSIVGTAAV